MMFERIRAHFRRSRFERQQPAMSAHAAFLDGVHTRRFAGTDKRRFEHLWCEIAEVCKVKPDTLHEDDKIVDRCPPPRSWLSSDTRLDDLEYVIMSESRKSPPPKQRPETIGQVLDYLLQPDPEESAD